jgi:hypothetical protein
MHSFEHIKTITLKLIAYCQANNWSGYDPYDALNSKIFKSLPFLNFKHFRLGFTQVMKRLPFNLRPLLLVPKTENPKAIALFLMAFLKLRKLALLEDESLIPLMIEKLITLRSPSFLINSKNPSNTSNLRPTACNRKPVPFNSLYPMNPINPSNPYFCWGYSFPWQTRTTLVPRGAPNLVCTTFVANALLDAYEHGCEAKMSGASSETILQPPTSDPLCLAMAISASEYILNELYWTDGNSNVGFSYPFPSLRSKTHNANFLAAALLTRVYKISGEQQFLETALSVARYSAGKQHDDGSWDYGESSTQGWIDNFHTGYNLCALRFISEYAGTSEFELHIRRGLEFYRKNFFREDGAPKYFHHRTYPLDIHSVAQSMITLLALKDLDPNNITMAHDVFRWAMAHLWDEKGYFCYRVYPFMKSKISYMRWSQACMLLALSALLEHCDQAARSPERRAPSERKRLA